MAPSILNMVCIDVSIFLSFRVFYVHFFLFFFSQVVEWTHKDVKHWLNTLGLSTPM